MEKKPNGKMIWVDEETHNRIAGLADANGRTIVGQLRWMIAQGDKAEAEQMLLAAQANGSKCVEASR
jgi:hypothetical protein